MLNHEQKIRLKDAIFRLNGMDLHSCAAVLELAENMSKITGDSICKTLPILMEKMEK